MAATCTKQAYAFQPVTGRAFSFCGIGCAIFRVLDTTAQRAVTYAHSLPVCIFPIPPIPCPHCAPLPLKRPHKRRCTESESGIAYRQDNEKRRDCRRCFGLGSSGGITAPPPPPPPVLFSFQRTASLKPIVEKLSIDILMFFLFHLQPMFMRVKSQ